MALLKTIDSPKDVKKLARSELPELAREIREQIVKVVSRTGGHLASSLGVVELTIALHYVFDSPEDKIIWDVGHQAYAHKLLTGRRQHFASLRQHGGISGFTRISESPHDAFTTGHSSTSISAGLGISAGKQLRENDGKVIAVIGDGSLTAGLAYEGLNQAGYLKKETGIIVILNDNDMSIARNVGALSSLLSRTFSATRLQGLRKELGDFLKSLPKIGDDIYKLAKRTEDSFKTFVTPGMLFEALNFDYFGPIDGHRLNHLIDILENIKSIPDPVLLHITTKKGKGYTPAEENPVYFHGCGSFDVETGTCVAPKLSDASYTDIFGQTMVALAAQHPELVAVTAAMPEGTGLSRFSERFPDRFFDVGIAEQHGVTFAAGLATQGFRPVVAIYSTFLQRAYDQIIHDVCIERLPVIFAIDRGGIVGEDGATHHGLFDLAYMRSLPHMVVMAPRDENELRRMLVTALAYDGPSAIRYPRGVGTGVALEDPIKPLTLGRAQVLATGNDLLIFAIGRCVNEALSAADILKNQNITATVVDCRFVKPLDADLLVTLTQTTKRVLTIEENVLQGGFGSAVLECLADHGITLEGIKRLGIDDDFVEHGAQSVLRAQSSIDAAAIVSAAQSLMAS